MTNHVHLIMVPECEDSLTKACARVFTCVRGRPAAWAVDDGHGLAGKRRYNRGMQRMMLVRWALLLLCLLLSMAASLSAQQAAIGTISGTVIDPDGRAASRMALEATNEKTRAIYRATTTAKGEYLFQVPAGTYTVAGQAGHIALRALARDHVKVAAGETVKLDIQLEEGTALNTLGDGRDFGSARAKYKVDPPAGPTPRMANGKPDLSGFWTTRGAPSDLGHPEFKDWVMAVSEKRRADEFRDQLTARCLPNGVPWALAGGAAQRFVESPGIMVTFTEGQPQRQIFLDGREHPSDPNPTWLGHSVGHWDGDTLVVDSVGFNDKTWLDREGQPHTEMLHIIERYRRPDLGHMEVEATLDDTGALLKPWILKRTYILDPTDEILEDICTENERDAQHVFKK